MFRKLRMQFIGIVMASVAIVLAVVFAGICVAEYQRSAASVDEALTSAIDRAAESAARVQGPFLLGDMRSSLERMGALSEWADDMLDAMGGLDEDDDDDDDDDGDDDGGDADDERDAWDDMREHGMMPGPRIGGRGDEQRDLVPVAVYTLTGDNVLAVEQGFTTASIDSELLQTAAGRVAELADGSGTFDDLGLHFQKRTVSSTTYVAFADTATTGGWQPLALTLGVAALGTLAVFFLIALALSKWALRPVQEAWDSQRQFVADASHDLKTPLTVILANASILLKHPDRSIASESQWIESTQIEAEHMQGLVNEMLELAQVEAGQQAQSAPHEPLDFSDLVDGETLMFDSVALEQGCLFDCDIQAGIRVAGDGQQLHKMVSTLVENAFKYVDAQGTVSVALHRTGTSAALSVRNTGSTISEADLPHIFDRFYRTDKARTSGAGGFGLGLAIAREIARAHGGDISCSSSPDAGTAFTATLPALPL